MKKILINRKIVNGPWGGGNNFVKSLYERLLQEGHQLVTTFQEDIDLIVMIDPRYDELGISINEIFHYKKINPKVKIIHRINECDARKNTNEIDKILLASNIIADETVFISEWLKDYFIKKGFSKKSYTIYNGCNLNHFFPEMHKQEDNLPIKIVTHHWSDNWLKGFDIYRDLDILCSQNPQKYEFTYIGRYAKEYLPISTKIISPKYGEDLGKELRKHDIYITASRWEPCGMHHIEGAASGLPVLFHKEGGGIAEGCRPHGIEFSSSLELEEKINQLFYSRKEFANNINYKFLSLERCLDQYMSIINNMF